MEANKNNKKVLIIIILSMLILIIGGTYAFFAYSREGQSTSQIIAGEIYLRYSDDGAVVNLSDNVFPESVEQARKEGRTDNILEFSLTGKNTTTNKDIYYEIKLAYGDNKEGKVRYKDSDLRFDLEETINGVPTRVLDNVSYDTIDNTRIWVNKIVSGSEADIKYTLRVWLSEDVIISDSAPNASYTTGEYAKSYANIKVSVYGDFEEKKMAADPTLASEVIKAKVGTDGLVAINTSGALASEGDEIREYRYSGSAKYCTYTVDGTTYNLAVEGDTCPNVDGEGNYIHICREKPSVSCEVAPNQTSPIDGEVDNYIWFNNEMWRIIGVFTETKSDGTEEELVKIIREVPLTNAEVPEMYTYNGTEMTMKFASETSDDYQYAYIYWNKSNYFSQTNSNDWTKAATQYYLNDETQGTSSYYNSINPTYRGMIETVQYNLSNVSWNSAVSEVYTAERSGDVHQDNVATWIGKIGMMYVSDYAYAAKNDAWSVLMYKYGIKTQPATLSNWMNDNTRGNEWTISIPSDGPSYAMTVFCDGSMSNYNTAYDGAVSPVLYLKSSVMITGGTGDEGTPYTLG